ncbi:VanZ family protein [Buchananella hordeovulneris]|uniref:VanZ family protein n=1 Tax=Buchananella hordeovulneris TaxID=52770 RepID=UPI000F5F376B|nr:VanZ family protein [Buchananella hordeovulneris]RRD52152.1 VanZ family protein [Buchananella hordeovulneris]
MSPWIWSGQTAILLGGASFAVLWIPMLVAQYRRWGSWNLARLAGSLAISLYGAALVSYTLLPLPDPQTLQCRAGSRDPQLTPLRFVSDISAEYAGHGSLRGLLTSFTFLQVAFNVLLFVPWGIILRRHLRRGFIFTVATGFLASLLIETTQGTGMWGLYPCAYRLADVDDLLTNTAGALLGALVAPLVLWWMPDARALSAKRLQPRPVTNVRRWTGQLIDLALYLFVASLLHTGVAVGATLLGFSPLSDRAWQLHTMAEVVTWLLVFVVPAWSHLGASFGQAAVWLTPMWRAADGALGHGRRWRRLARASVVSLPTLATSVTLLWHSLPTLELVSLTLPLLAVLLVPCSRTKRSLSGWVTRAEFVDIRTLTGDAAVHRDKGGFRRPAPVGE